MEQIKLKKFEKSEYEKIMENYSRILGKPVTALYGVDGGSDLAERLAAFEDPRSKNNIRFASQVLGWFLIFNQESYRFEDWFKRTFAPSPLQMSTILYHLKEWCEVHANVDNGEGVLDGSGEDFAKGKDMALKPVTAVNGVTEEMAVRLRNWKDPETGGQIVHAYQLYGWYLRLCNKYAFVLWFNTIIPGAPRGTAENIFDVLDAWREV